MALPFSLPKFPSHFTSLNADLNNRFSQFFCFVYPLSDSAMQLKLQLLGQIRQSNIALENLTSFILVNVIESMGNLIPEVFIDGDLLNYRIPDVLCDKNFLLSMNACSFVCAVIEDVFLMMLSSKFPKESQLKTDCITLIKNPCLNGAIRFDNQLYISFTYPKTLYGFKFSLSQEFGSLQIMLPSSVPSQENKVRSYPFSLIEEKGLFYLADEASNQINPPT